VDPEFLHIPTHFNQLHIVHVAAGETMCVFWLNFWQGGNGEVVAGDLGRVKSKPLKPKTLNENFVAQPWDRIEFSVACHQATNFCDPCGHVADPHQLIGGVGEREPNGKNQRVSGKDFFMACARKKREKLGKLVNVKATGHTS